MWTTSTQIIRKLLTSLSLISSTVQVKEEYPELNKLIIASIVAMTDIANTDSVKTIVKYIKKYDPEVRMAAVKALGLFLHDSATKLLGERI